MKLDRAELRRGLAEARGYLLSHHLPSEWYRCYAPVVFGRRIRICARCAGIYPGILAGVFAYFAGSPAPTGFLLVVVLPSPALLDWTLTSYTGRRGYNVVRTITGALLGYGYGLGLALLFLEGTPRVLAVGAGYALIAGALLYYE